MAWFTYAAPDESAGMLTFRKAVCDGTLCCTVPSAHKETKATIETHASEHASEHASSWCGKVRGQCAWENYKRKYLNSVARFPQSVKVRPPKLKNTESPKNSSRLCRSQRNLWPASQPPKTFANPTALVRRTSHWSKCFGCPDTQSAGAGARRRLRGGRPLVRCRHHRPARGPKQGRRRLAVVTAISQVKKKQCANLSQTFAGISP